MKTLEYVLENYKDLETLDDSIYLHQKSIDLEIQIPTQKVEQLDYIIVNGIKFKKDVVK